MKKLYLFPIVLFALTFSSCKKEHVCTCVISGNYQGTPISYTQIDTYPDSRKKDARKNCVSGNVTSPDYPTLILNGNCTLK